MALPPSLPLHDDEVARIAAALGVSDSLVRLRESNPTIRMILRLRLTKGPRSEGWTDPNRPGVSGPRGCPVSDEQLRSLLYFPTTSIDSILTLLALESATEQAGSSGPSARRDSYSARTGQTSSPFAGISDPSPGPARRPHAEDDPTLMGLINDGLGWCYRELAWLTFVGPWRSLVAFATAGGRRRDFLFAQLVFVVVMTCAAGSLLFLSLALPESHRPRWLALLPLCAVVAEAMRPKKKPRRRLAWLGGGAALALAGWLLIPTSDGHALAPAEWRSRSLAAALASSPAEDVADVRDDADARDALAAAFPHVRGRLDAAERDWSKRWGERVADEARPRAKQKPDEALAFLDEKRAALSAAFGTRAAGAHARLRRELLALRFETYARSVRPLLKADRFAKAAAVVHQLTKADEIEAREAGFVAEWKACRDRYGYLADLARLAGKPDPE